MHVWQLYQLQSPSQLIGGLKKTNSPATASLMSFCVNCQSLATRAERSSTPSRNFPSLKLIRHWKRQCSMGEAAALDGHDRGSNGLARSAPRTQSLARRPGEQ